MSCLSKDFRLNSQKEFNKLYKSGKSWHTSTFVAFFMPNLKSKFAFVASKKIGNAVLRAKAKRRLRATLLLYDNRLKDGSYIFVAKNPINEKSFIDLQKDFNFAFKRLELLK
ncbi:ribonuclease P protein component [Aliarcobacter skirrowii]|uniref:ribonuclease P protein component n=1 Tax=Aliarcobacter skirrowii TaxID=28200 RepID=UPI0029A0339C|nr:ribonuclease P protein component [Aliarcobacter skirrowii]MDX4062363.1 ribonuclease P protein component [Aliarcobacter skirrowii]